MQARYPRQVQFYMSKPTVEEMRSEQNNKYNIVSYNWRVSSVSTSFNCLFGLQFKLWL